MDVVLIKTLTGLIPGDPETDAWYQKIKLGQGIHSDFKLMRNIGFHRKFFALLNLAYGYWTPGEINTKWGVPQKSFESFRKNLTVLAGYGHLVFNIDGTYKMEADSISFSKMDQIDFEKLYSNVLDEILKRIPILKDLGKDELNKLVDKVLQFA